MSDWKKNTFDKFSPILGIEKTAELISSIEKVYFIDQSEEAITIIDYLIDVNNSNIQSSVNLVEEYNKLNKEWWSLEKTKLTYSIFNSTSALFIIINKNSFSDTIYYCLLGLISIPLFYDLFKNITNHLKK